MSTFTGWTVGDLLPSLSGVCTSAGAAAVLTGATGVEIHVQRPDRTVITRAATTQNLATGAWTLDWIAGDLTVSGTYRVEVQVTFTGPKPETFSGGSFSVRDQIA